MHRKHILPPADLSLPQTLHDDRHKLEEVDVPIITVSATFKGEISKLIGRKIPVSHEAVFSRAHYSMATAVLAEAHNQKKTTWLVDPTNYVSEAEWKKVIIVEYIGQLTARIPILKTLKDILDSFVRSKFPLRHAIEEPLKYVIERCQKPIIAMHYEAGNIIATQGKKVISVVTDPYVHQNYIYECDRKNIAFAVFNDDTREQFIKKAKLSGKILDPKRVVVTGPPIDPRIISARDNKKSADYRKRKLRLVVTTSGLGTNKNEIKSLLSDLLTLVKLGKLQVILYASTHNDFSQMYQDLAQKFEVPITLKLNDPEAPLRIFHFSSIVSANDALIDYAFPWADGFITKPSGDMAYDAVAAGCFVLSLNPWGEWEEKIETIFSGLGVLKHADVESFGKQIEDLENQNWYEIAISKALNIDKLFLTGAKKIVDLQQSGVLQ